MLLFIVVDLSKPLYEGNLLLVVSCFFFSVLINENECEFDYFYSGFFEGFENASF